MAGLLTGDIKGKALGVPVYQLIGGKCREKVRAYGGGATPDWVTCGQPGSQFSSDDLIPMLQKFDATAWAASLPEWSGEPHCPVWGGFTCHKVCYLPATMLAGMPPPIVLNACVEAFAVRVFVPSSPPPASPTPPTRLTFLHSFL
jgi:hypothetical protein